MEKELVKNRKAFHDYEILDQYEAGVVLQGTEVKSLREGGGSLQDAYVKIADDEPLLLGTSIAPYRFGTIYNHEERRQRKLLLHKNEIIKLKKAVDEKGLTLIVLALYLKKGRVKARIALARGKKSVDKRASIKEREQTRMMQRALKQ